MSKAEHKKSLFQTFLELKNKNKASLQVQSQNLEPLHNVVSDYFSPEEHLMVDGLDPETRDKFTLLKKAFPNSAILTSMPINNPFP